MEDKLLIALIGRVKIRYLKCKDIEFKKYIGEILTGDIDIMHNKLSENSKNN